MSDEHSSGSKESLQETDDAIESSHPGMNENGNGAAAQVSQSNGRPETLDDLFRFYYSSFKPMYSALCSDNMPPAELLLEVVAAFDHLSRYWRPDVYGGPDEEKSTADRAAGHLKRGLFDAHKLILKDTRKNYEKLAGTDTSAIDNGEFDRSCIEQWRKIRTGAAHARSCEGNTVDDWHRAFDQWDTVVNDCNDFDDRFTLNSRVNWAQRRTWVTNAMRRGEGILLGVAASIIAGAILYWWLG